MNDTRLRLSSLGKDYTSAIEEAEDVMTLLASLHREWEDKTDENSPVDEEGTMRAELERLKLLSSRLQYLGITMGEVVHQMEWTQAQHAAGDTPARLQRVQPWTPGTPKPANWVPLRTTGPDAPFADEHNDDDYPSDDDYGVCSRTGREF